MKIVTSKSFYRSLLSVALPIAIQNLIVFSTSMMDTIMLGRADTTGVFLSASSLANQPFFILTMVCFGLSGASSVLSSQYWGKRDTASIKIIIATVLRYAFVISLLMELFVLIFPHFTMSMYSSNSEIIEAGVKYLRIIGFAYVLFGVGNTMLCAVRSVEIVKISVVVNSTSFLVNVFLNWVLIFGKLGFPAMGITGAAIATLIARVLEFAISMFYILKIDKRLAFRLHDFLDRSKILRNDLLRHGTPVFINEVLWSLGITLQASILGHITYSAGDPVAANSIAGMIQQISTIFIFGIANAAAVLVGKSVGARKADFAKEQAVTLNILALGVGLIACGIILVLKNPILSIYDFAEETIALSRSLINVMAVIVIFVSFAAINIVGILRGGGDTRFCLTSEMICLWVFAIPLALLGTKLMLPVPIVLILMKIDEPLKSVFCICRLISGKWIHFLAR